MLGRVREVAASRGFQMPDVTKVQPAALWKWVDLTVDPDGHVWIKPWVRPENDAPGTKVLRVDPSTRRVEKVRLPSFPKAFGAPGVDYVIETDPDTDELLVTRYERRDPTR